jgi:hypothetical protein
MLRTCFSTAPSLMKSRWAILLFDRPSAVRGVGRGTTISIQLPLGFQTIDERPALLAPGQLSEVAGRRGICALDAQPHPGLVSVPELGQARSRPVSARRQHMHPNVLR